MHVFSLLLLMLALPAAWATLLYNAILLVLPSAIGWIAGEVALLRDEIQKLGGFWGHIVQSVISGAVAAIAAYAAAHGLNIPGDLSQWSTDALLGAAIAIIKAWLGINSQLRLARLRRGLKL